MTKQEYECKLQDDIALFVYNPLGFVLFVFPWGEGALSEYPDGPDEWQTDILREIGEKAKTAKDAIQIAVASGHGIGKTALIAWIIIWFLSTRPTPQAVVTSNTKTQLDTKTWRELAKWHKLAINSHWFQWTATKFYMKSDPETWFASAIPWSKEHADAFAGTHEEYVLVIYDEASQIVDVIWEVSEGAMTTPGAIWIAFGNPTQNTGRFKECFGRFRHRWITRQIDSRTAKMANRAQIDKWIEDYGEDSDFVRVRVKGEFPRASSMQFISEEIVQEAINRVLEVDAYEFAPIVMGVDVARFGDDQTVMVIRRGLKLLHIERHRELDLMTTSAMVARLEDKWGVNVTFVDAVGIGAGVVDRLNQLGRRGIIGVVSGSRATNQKYFNLRAEMWGNMREWLEQADIKDDKELKTDLTAPEYGFATGDKLQLEKKEDIKGRGLASPDSGDALALTFALPVTPEMTCEEEDYDNATPSSRSRVTGY